MIKLLFLRHRSPLHTLETSFLHYLLINIEDISIIFFSLSLQTLVSPFLNHLQPLHQQKRATRKLSKLNPISSQLPGKLHLTKLRFGEEFARKVFPFARNFIKN